MSFLGIVTLVLVALIILSLLWISGKRNKNRVPTSGTYYDWFRAGESTQKSTRKRARNVTVKDIKDDK